MVADAVATELAQSGRSLLAQLDKADFPVQAAFWLWDREADKWRLFIASPMVDSTGPLAVYRVLQENLPAEAPFSLQDISVVSPRDRRVDLFRAAVHTGPKDVVGMRFTRESVNNVFIDDAYVYRVA